MNVFLRISLCLCAQMLSLPALAGSACAAASEDCVAVGSWEFALGVGLGARSNPIAEGDALPIVFIPTITYYGERLFWQTDTVGFTLVDSDRQMLNAIATVSYDQMYFSDWSLGNFSVDGGGVSGAVFSNRQLLVSENLGGMESNQDADFDTPVVIGPADNPTGEATPTPQATPDTTPPDRVNGPQNEVGSAAIDLDALHKRRTAGLVGLEYSYEADQWGLGLQWLVDASGVHDGQELRFGADYRYRLSRSTLVVGLGAEWKDARTLDYYYGVRESEVSNPVDAYRVGSGTFYYAKLQWQYPVTERWQWQFSLNHRLFPASVRDSPIVEDEGSTAVFVGGVYRF